MKQRQLKFKKGAASFYIVAFATLILMIVATSFAAVIISEVTRTSNDDLSQSAYDSAMAGIEDAKLAFYNYQNCKAQAQKEEIAVTQFNNDGVMTCGEIIWLVEQGYDVNDGAITGYNSCDMVGTILGRTIVQGNGVQVQEGEANNMQQYYTCTKIITSLPDYRGTLSSSNTTEVIKTKFDGVSANDISKVKISWYDSASNDKAFQMTSRVGSGMFGTATTIPPTISLAMVQTGETFSLSDFDNTVGNTTDRGMVYLVPVEGRNTAVANDYYQGAWTTDKNKCVNLDSGRNGCNYVSSNGFLKSNDKTKTNVPFLVHCDDENGGFACDATIDLPGPIGGNRNDNTFVFIVSLPYGKPSTDYSLEFICGNRNCAYDRQTKVNDPVLSDSIDTVSNSKQAFLDGVQIEMDSTGRANDLYRRIVTRLKNSDDFSLSTMGALELGSGGMNKIFASSDDNEGAVTCEYNFLEPGEELDC